MDKSRLTPDQRLELSGIVQSRSLPARYVFRAKLILMLAARVSFHTIKVRLQTSAPAIIRWKRRFLQFGLDGLDTYHPGQQATVVTPALRARILSATRKETQRRLHPLELPQTGSRVGRQQRRRPSGLERSGLETAPPGTLHGQRRSRVREQGRRYHGPLFAPAATCRRVLRRRKDRHSGPGPALRSAAALAGTRGSLILLLSTRALTSQRMSSTSGKWTPFSFSCLSKMPVVGS
jgi:hypothetical protein